MIKIDSLDWKKALSLVREGDFAHAGEIEAIEVCFKDIAKEATRKLLDVGCGLGGTANYLEQHGWGTVIGIDIQGDIIESAKSTYPRIPFYTCDVKRAAKVLDDTFDIIYLLNSFYAFDDQRGALIELKKLAHGNTTLIIFDYVDKRMNREGEIFETCTHPIVPSDIRHLLEESGWKAAEITDLTKQYEWWYAAFVDRIRGKGDEITALVGREEYEFFLSFYVNILQLIKRGQLGGCVIHARSR